METATTITARRVNDLEKVMERFRAEKNHPAAPGTKKSSLAFPELFVSVSPFSLLCRRFLRAPWMEMKTRTDGKSSDAHTGKARSISHARL